MHFFALASDLKRDTSNLKDDLLKCFFITNEMSHKLGDYIPFSGDNHSHAHFQLSYRVALIRSRLFQINKELDIINKILEKHG